MSETKKRSLSFDRLQSTGPGPDIRQHKAVAEEEERAFKSRSLLEVKEHCLATVMTSHSSSHPNLIRTEDSAADSKAISSKQKTADESSSAAAAVASESKDISVLNTDS